MNDSDKTIPPPDDHASSAADTDDRTASNRETIPPDPDTDTDSIIRKTNMPEISQQFGRYEIKKQLGKGAMGSVYLARDAQLDRLVAIKVPQMAIKEGSREYERFYREAQSAGTLRHANICPVYDVGEINQTHYICMAYIEGRSLYDYISTGRKISQNKAASIIKKMALALENAHQQGIVHRDLKPENIIIDRQGEPIITDFGIAHRYQEQNARLTQSGALLGSPAYMSPEQIEGDTDQIDPRSDIYSLGVLFYELLTGRLPFEGTTAAVLGQIISKEAPAPSEFREDLAPDLETICLRMVEKKPEDRFLSMQKVADSVSDFLNQVPVKQPVRENDSPYPDTVSSESALTPLEIQQPIVDDTAELSQKPVKMKQLPSWLITIGVVLGLLITGLAIAVVTLFIQMNNVPESDNTVPALTQKSLDDNDYTFWIDGEQFTDLNQLPKLSPGSHKIELKDSDGNIIDETSFYVDDSETEGIIPHLGLNFIDNHIKIVAETDYLTTKRGMLENLLRSGVKVELKLDNESESDIIETVNNLPEGKFEVIGFDLSLVEDLGQVEPEQIQELFPGAKILSAED